MSDVIKIALIYLVRIVDFLIVVRVILSWLPFGNQNGIMSFIYLLTEPILAPIRNLLRKSPLGGQGMMLDFSPIIAFIIINLLMRFLTNIL